MQPLRLAILATLLTMTRPAAAAAVEAHAPPAAEELPTVRVFAKAPRQLVDIAASVTVVDEAAIQRELAQDFRDLIRYTPGLSMRYDATRFGLDTISIRGIGGNRVLLETDGVPSPSGFAAGALGDSGRPYTDLDLIKRIEILRGPASALYGSDAIGGVVSSRTLDPVDLLGSDDAALRLRAGYNSDDRSKVTSVAGAARVAGGVEAMVALAHREGDALRNESAVLDANPRDYHRSTLLARAVLSGLDHPLRVTFGGEHGHARTEVDSLELLPPRYTNTVDMQGDDRARSYRVIVDQTLMDFGGLDHLEWRAYWQQSTVEQATFEQRRAAPPRTPAQEVEREFSYRETTIGSEVTMAHDLTLGTLAHRLVFGGEAMRSQMTEARNGLQTTLPSGATTNVLLGEVMPVRDFPRSTTTTLGVYLQDEFRPRDGRLTVLPALRLDHYRLRPKEDAMYREDNPRQTPVSLTHTSLTPRLGLTWRVADDLALFGQYVRGFRSPPFGDVNIGLDVALFNYRAIPNPDLRPEKSDAFELGLRSTGEALSGSVTLFYTRYRDFIESRVNIGVDPDSGTTLYQSRNLARAETFGAEAEGLARLGEWRPSLAPWAVRFAVSYARGNDLEGNRPLNSVDPLKAVVGLRYAAPGGAWDAELLTTAIAGKDRVNDGATPLVRTGGFVTIDLLAQWRVTGRLTAQAGLFNLTDRSYFEWSDVRERAANDPLIELYRRPGRNGSISFSYRY